MIVESPNDTMHAGMCIDAAVCSEVVNVHARFRMIIFCLRHTGQYTKIQRFYIVFREEYKSTLYKYSNWGASCSKLHNVRE